MREYIKSLKVLWSDERGRAIIKLGIYIIFMMIVVLYARSLYKVKSTPKKTALEAYGTTVVKEETIRINDDIEYQVTFKDRIKFFNDTKECTVYEETKYACGPIFEEAEIYFWNIKPKLIYSLVKDKKPKYTINYDDNKTTAKAYSVPLDEIVRYFKGAKLVDLEEVHGEVSEVIITDNGTKVTKVAIDLSDYYFLATNKSEKYKVEIEY